jgi:peroxiredoxin
MLPHEKSLVKRLEGQPFALIGINSDGPVEKVKRLLSEHQITWRQAIDGDTSGPWATAWNVQGWPTIYVLDREGRIRYRDVRDQEMEDAVLKLLAEMKPR